MNNRESFQYEISLKFEQVKLPPVTDILILGKKYPHGKHGVLQAFKFIAPDEFVLFEITDSENIDAILVDKRIAKRMTKEKILEVLKKYIFPYVADDEAVKVDIDLKVSCVNIKGEL